MSKFIEVQRLVEYYECCKSRYKYIIAQIRYSKEELSRGCTSYMYMLGDEEGRLRGVQIEKEKLKDFKFCVRTESTELRKIKYKIKAEQRKITRLNQRRN